jgi:hypothetical protein
MVEVLIRVGEEEFLAELDADAAPDTVAAIRKALPLEGVVRTWGDEIYFEVPVQAAPENSRDVVRKGDLGFWPDGNCFCIFYGATPESPSEDQIVPASAVNVIGTVAEADELKKHCPGEPITVESAETP